MNKNKIPVVGEQHTPIVTSSTQYNNIKDEYFETLDLEEYLEAEQIPDLSQRTFTPPVTRRERRKAERQEKKKNGKCTNYGSKKS